MLQSFSKLINPLCRYEAPEQLTRRPEFSTVYCKRVLQREVGLMMAQQTKTILQ
jgi:hypothetical protein